MSRALPLERVSAHAKDTRVKICGITRAEDARLAASLGADFLGLVFAPSPRRVEPAAVQGWVRDVRAEFPAVCWAGVFVEPTNEDIAGAAEFVELDLLQIHGPTVGIEFSSRPFVLAVSAEELEPAAARWTGVAASEAPYAFLVDSSANGRTGGTGRTFDWSKLPSTQPERVFLAGGLSPGNVAQAIRTARPFAVDASSRLESAAGIKDADRLRAFFEAIRTMAD